VSIDPLNIGLTGLEAYQTQVDVAANNIANVATPGFQAQDVQFGNLLSGGVKARIVANAGPASTPAPLESTGVPTNLAVAGDGYFVLSSANGPVYTLAGNFIIGGNSQLVDAATGDPVQSTNGTPIAIPSGATSVNFSPDGTVSAAFANGSTQTVGRLALATFANPSGLARISGGYVLSADSGPAQIGAPATGPYGSIVAGELTGSNVDLPANIIALMAAEHAFEANARSIATGDAMLGTIINDIK
jgi:flagellar hook protein FlgE